jgi:hypothetical protein
MQTIKKKVVYVYILFFIMYVHFPILYPMSSVSFDCLFPVIIKLRLDYFSNFYLNEYFCVLYIFIKYIFSETEVMKTYCRIYV